MRAHRWIAIQSGTKRERLERVGTPVVGAGLYVATVTDSQSESNSDVAFPGHEQAATSQTSRTRSFPAWVGTAERLRRVVDIMETSLRTSFEQARHSIEAAPKYSQNGMIKAYEIRTTISEGAGRMERQGDIEQILAQVDLSDVESVVTGNRGDQFWKPEAKVTIKFGGMHSAGATVEVRGSEPQWVSGTTETLAAELAKGVPRWGWLYSEKVYWGYYILCALFVFAPVLVWWPEVIASLWPILALAVVVVFASFILNAWVDNRVLRRFELLEPGSKSRVSKRLLGVGSTVGFVASVLTIIAFVADR